MWVTRKADLAMRVMMTLAGIPGRGGHVPISALARELSVPLPFLQQVLHVLRRGRLVAAVRGRSGGYRLARPAGNITAGEVIRLVQGTVAPSPCSEMARPLCGGEFCAVREVWIRVRKATERVVDGVTVADLAREDRRARR